MAPVFRGNAIVPEDRMVVINYSYMPMRFNYPSPEGQSIMTPEGGAVLWKRWRLLMDRALYNLDSDPMQENNVIDQHPEVVEKMRKHLYDWWDTVESGDTSVTFTVDLKEGPKALHAWFNDENGTPITAPYYVYVTRK